MIALLQLLYGICALALGLYTAGQSLLLWRYWRSRKQPAARPALTETPTVTVQLPLYNEAAVAERLLDAVAGMQYPRDKLCIQVLDDSSDGTVQVVARKLAALQRRGFRVQHLRRGQRRGYKAGALAAGFAQSRSECYAIFDADFVPPPDFLQRTVPQLLAQADIGFVQCRWGHLNADENRLTRAQKLAIDTHFAIEQAARSHSGWLLPFNGTGALWRRECIAAAGGWSAATLTEDLDLSYRAQMVGWRAHYLAELVVPGEIPPQLAAYKRQQARWAAGSVQCLLKLLPRLLRSRLSRAKKIMALQHLCQYLPQPLLLLMLLLTPLLLRAGALLQLPLVLGFLGLAPPLMYAASQARLYRNWRSGMAAFPTLLLIGTGMSCRNSLAVFSAFLRRRQRFQRTPKFRRDWARSPYALAADRSLLLELLLLLYALWAAALAWDLQRELFPYLCLYVLSFCTIVAWSIGDSWRRWRARKTAPVALEADGLGWSQG